MAATQSLASISITSSSGSGGVCRLNGISEDQQQQKQLVRFNIEDFDSPNERLKSPNVYEPILSDNCAAGTSNNGDIRNDDSVYCNEIGHNGAATAATSINQSQELTSITLSVFNHDQYSRLNQSEPQRQEELAAATAARQHSTNYHRCVQTRETNSYFDNQQQRDQENLNQDQRRIRRLFAILRLWRPKTEMQPVAQSSAIETIAVGPQREPTDQQHNQHRPHNHLHHHHHNRNLGATAISQAMVPDPEADAAASALAVVAPQAATSEHSEIQQRSCSHYIMRNPVMFVPTCASNVPFATNITPITLGGPANELGGVSERKLWQSLVMPLVLGCIIFLIAVWTKQISLVVVNETLVMVIILGAVFIIMSGFAFLLAQDQVPPTSVSSLPSPAVTGSNDDDDDNGSLTLNNAQYQREFALRLHQQHRHYPRLPLTTVRDSQRNHEHELRCQHGPNGGHRSYHHHHHHRNQSHQHDDGERNSSRKCCGPIAIIDCQPPDYYSAMQNSFPVNLYPGRTNNNSSNSKQTNLVRINIDNDEHQMCSPPTYDELINQNG